jgi:hypothetical protein
MGLLFLPYTGMVLSFSLMGAMLAGFVYWDRVVATVIIISWDWESAPTHWMPWEAKEQNPGEEFSQNEGYGLRRSLPSLRPI